VIAAALAQSAQLLLLDEPTASLDLGYQLEISSLLARLNHEHGVTMAISTHDLNLAASICRELVLMRDGRVLAAGRTEDVLTSENVKALYDVEADVHVHSATGHMTVVPIRPITPRRRPEGGIPRSSSAGASDYTQAPSDRPEDK
jgi:iron complex transport system ATP-binding protein